MHVSELGTDYFQFNEAMHELRGERTGQRFRLTDPVSVQVSRVDLEARKIEFRLVRGSSYQELMRGLLPGDAEGARKGAPRPAGKRAAKPRDHDKRERATESRHAEAGHVKTAAPPARAARKTATAKSGRPQKR